jgi:transcriptional regulator with XRE-family HTH domain
MTTKAALTPALLRFWRTRRGMSQLDLALTAGVSSRHVSFLETGRAQPSREMLLKLSAALRVPLRDRNALLRAAGFDEEFAEPDLQSGLTPAVQHALERMLAQQEPYPMGVMNRHYDVVRYNRAAAQILARFIAEPAALGGAPNAMRMLFDPRQARPFICDWELTARTFLLRLQLEVIEHPGDSGLSDLLDELLDYPGVPESWRQPDFSVSIESTLPLRLRRPDLEVGFITTLTAFSAPGNITLEELRIESYFPIDQATERACQRLSAETGPPTT